MSVEDNQCEHITTRIEVDSKKVKGETLDLESGMQKNQTM